MRQYSFSVMPAKKNTLKYVATQSRVSCRENRIQYKHTIILHVPDKKNPNEEILDKPICTCSIELYSFIKKNRHQVAETITLLEQLV